jgi:hypothetical protein
LFIEGDFLWISFRIQRYCKFRDFSLNKIQRKYLREKFRGSLHNSWIKPPCSSSLTDEEKYVLIRLQSTRRESCLSQSYDISILATSLHTSSLFPSKLEAVGW